MDKDNKVVNTEEQNRAVNPGTGDYQETSPKESAGTSYSATDNQEEIEKKNTPDKPARAEE